MSTSYGFSARSLSKRSTLPTEPGRTPRRPRWILRRASNRRTSSPERRSSSPQSIDDDLDEPVSGYNHSPFLGSPPTPSPRSPGRMGSDEFPSVNSRDYSRPQSTAEGWSKLAKTLISHDETKIKDYKEDMDTLLVFAGLFSAVVTAFLIQVLPALTQDPFEIMQEQLSTISTQLQSFVVSNGFINSTQNITVTSQFQVSSNAFYTILLWFSSLISSLIAASLAMLVKQWLREYMAMEYLNPQAWARVRHFRHRGLVTWRVFQVAEALPLLLQTSLILFFAGLSYFIRSHHSLIGWIITGFIIMWIVIYQATFTAPMFASNCPYKTPLFRSIFKRFRRVFWFVNKDGNEPEAEDTIRRSSELDSSVLASADAAFVDTEVLEMIRECLSGADGPSVLGCIRQILIQRGHNGQDDLDYRSLNALQGESSREKLTLVRTMTEAVDREVVHQLHIGPKLKVEGWMKDLLNCSIPHADYALGPEVFAYVTRWISQGGELAQAVLVSLTYITPTSKLRRSLPTAIDRVVLMKVIEAASGLNGTPNISPLDLCRVVLCFILRTSTLNLPEFKGELNKLVWELIPYTPSQRAKFLLSERLARDCIRLSNELNRVHHGLLDARIFQALGSVCRQSTV